MYDLICFTNESSHIVTMIHLANLALKFNSILISETDVRCDYYIKSTGKYHINETDSIEVHFDYEVLYKFEKI